MGGPDQLPLPLFWQMLGGVLAQMLAEKAHGTLTITVREGRVQLVDQHRQYLPTQLPAPGVKR